SPFFRISGGSSVVMALQYSCGVRAVKRRAGRAFRYHRAGILAPGDSRDMGREQQQDAGDAVARNRLDAETSPYLLQHADNPVAWQPWDGAALAAARELDRPI